MNGKWIRLLFIFWIAGNPAGAQAATDSPGLLVLHSGSPTCQWTRNINAGIVDTLGKAGSGIALCIEHMDIIEGQDAPRFELLQALYRHKYQTNRFGAILCSGNEAFDFLMRYRADLFPGTPLIFCGVEEFDDRMIAGQEEVTGVVEAIDLQASIEIMLRLNNTLDRVFLWGIARGRSEERRARAVSAIECRSPTVEIIHLRDKSLSQGMAEIGKAEGRAGVFLLSTVRNDQGRIIPGDITARKISATIDYPVYSLWDFFLGHGIVGGKLARGSEQGRISTEMAMRIITGTPVAEIPIVRKGPNRFMFDHRQLERFGITDRDLPVNAVIINKPVSTNERFGNLAWSILFIIPLLGLLIVILGVTVFRRVKRENELQQNRDLLEQRVQDHTDKLSAANLELRRFEQMVATTPTLICLVDRGYRIRYVNEAYLDAFQRGRDDIIDRSIAELIGRERFEKVAQNQVDLALDGHTVEFETWVELPVLGRCYLTIHYHPITDSEGGIQYVSVAARDVTTLKASEDSLKILSDRLSLAAKASGAGVWEWDKTNDKLIWDDQMMRIYGLPPGAFTGEFADWRDRVHPEDVATVEKVFITAIEKPEPFELEFRILREDGEIRHIRSAALTRLDRNGNGTRIIGVNWDISEHKRMQKELTRLATIDSLTGISNRSRFLERAHDEFVRCLRYDSPLAMLMIDIDHFKSINDAFGHLVGDAVLRKMAQRSLAVLRKNDIFGRIGGEEFCAILIESGLDNAAEVSERLRHAIERMKVKTESGEVSVTISIGFTILRQGDNDLEQITRRADKALYQAKREGRNRAVEI